MNDWLRSLSVLAIASGSVVAVMLGLAALIVPSPGSTALAPGASSPDASPVAAVPNGGGRPVTQVGGALAVTGDRAGTFVVDRETADGRYGLEGRQGRILFDEGPLTVARVQYDSLEFFLEPGDCEIEPGERHDPTGVAGAHVRCDGIEDVRGNGRVTLDGTLGVAADLVDLRGDLPPTGGTVTVGSEKLTFEHARLYIGPQAAVAARGYALSAVDTTGEGVIAFDYEPRSHELTLSYLQLDEARGADTPRDGCSLTDRDLGLLNPHTRLVRLIVTCGTLELPELGPVPVEGEIVVELSELRR